jgi:hypothetical protein
MKVIPITLNCGRYTALACIATVILLSKATFVSEA